MRRVLVCSFLFVSLALVLAQDEKREEARTDTGALTVYIPDLARLRSSWGESFFGKLLGDEELAPFIESLDKAEITPYNFLKHLVRRNAGVDLKETFSIFDGSLLLRLVDADGKKNNISEMLDLLVLLRSNKKDTLSNIIANLTHSLTKTPPEGIDVSSSESKYKDCTIRSLSVGKDVLHHAFLGDVWAFSFDRKNIEGVIDASKGEKGTLFADNELIKSLLEGKKGEDYELLLLCDGKRLLKGFEPMMAGEIKEVFEAVVELLPNFTFKAASEKNRYRETLTVRYDELPEGFDSKLKSPETLLAETKDIFLFGLLPSSYLRGWAKLLREMLDEMFREAPGQDVLKRKPLADMEKELKFSFDKDLLGRLKGTVQVYVAEPEGGGAFPEVFAVAELKEKEKFIALFDRIIERINLKASKAKAEGGWDVPELKINKTVIGELTLYSIDFHKEWMEFDFPYTPTIGFVGERLIFGTQPQVVRAVVRQLKTPVTPSEEFKKELERAEGKNLFLYLNLPRIAAYAYNTGIPALRSEYGLDLKDRGVEFFLLPDVRTVTKHFRPSFVTATSEGNSYRIEVETEGFGLLSSSVTVLGYLGVAYLQQFFVPRGVSLRKLAEMDLTVVSDMRTLMTAMETFYILQGKYPTSLDELIERGILNGDFPKNKTHKIQILGTDKKGWSAVANPKEGSPLKRFYFINQTGILRISDTPQVGPDSKKWEPVSDVEVPVPERK